MLQEPVDVRAACVAGISFAVVHKFLKSWLRARPEGPNLYRLKQKDSMGTRLQRIFAGDAIATSSLEAGEAHIKFTEAARKAMGNHEAHAVFFMAQKERLLLSNPGDVKYVLIDHAAEFVKPDFMRILSLVLGDFGLVNIVDEDVHTVQYRHVSRAFSPAAVREIAATTMRTEFGEMIREIGRRVDGAAAAATGPAASPAAPAGAPLREIIHKALTLGALNVISEAAFHTKDFLQFHDLLEQMRGLPNWVVLIPVCVSRWLPPFWKVARQRRQLGQVTNQIIDRIRNGDAMPTTDVKNKKLIDLLAENKQLTKEQILDHTTTFVFAGHETTANGLNWLCYLLATNPRAQEALAEELADAFDPGTTPAVATLTSLPYLNAVVLEGLRRFAPVGTFIRCSQTDHILPGSKTYIPAGTPFHVAVHALHHNKAVWGPDVDEFRPERWIEEPGLKERVTPCSFLPFAAGKRACIGKDFAMHELLIGTALLFRNFSMAWPEGQPRPVRKVGVVVRPTVPFELLITLRQG